MHKSIIDIISPVPFFNQFRPETLAKFTLLIHLGLIMLTHNNRSVTVAVPVCLFPIRLSILVLHVQLVYSNHHWLLPQSLCILLTRSLAWHFTVIVVEKDLML